MDDFHNDGDYTPDPCKDNDDSLTPVPLACFNYLWRNKGKCTTQFKATNDPNFIQMEGTEDRFTIAGQTLGMARRAIEEAAANPLWNPPLCNRSGAATLIGERTKLKELDMMVTQYNTANQTFLNYKKTGNTQGANDNMAVLKAINDNILSKLTELQKMNDTIYPHGIANQQKIQRNNPTLNAHLDELQKQHTLVNKRIREYNNAFGKKEDKELVYYAHTWRYIFYLVVAFIVSIFVIRAYTSEDQHSLELVILIVAAILAFVHFYSYLVKKFT